MQHVAGERFARTVTIMAVLALVLSVIAGPVGATSPDPRQDLTNVLDALPALDGDHAEKAAKKLTEALADKFWTSNATLSKDGDKSFDKAADAVKELDKAGLTQFIDPIVAAYAGLAEDAIAAAKTAGAKSSDVEKAEKEFDKAAKKLADGKAAKAIDQYGKAWKKATGAAKKASTSPSVDQASTPPGGGDGGKYSIYTFVFDDVLSEYDLTVTGSNQAGAPGFTGQGNEGFLQVGAEWMQLHVSCSDAFTNGTGDKSDPSVDSQYRVRSAHIVKMRDGAIDKECDINGGIYVPPPDGADG